MFNRYSTLSLRLVLLFTCAMASAHSRTEPWIDAGDEIARHHLQVLADRGRIQLPVSTWPLMWSAVSHQLTALDSVALDETERLSYQYLRHELRRARRRANAGQQITIGSGRPGLAEFGSVTREPWEIRHHANYTGSAWAGRLQVSAVGDPLDGQNYRLDGSYISRIWGNWALGLGAIDRWWGPGWQSSLILSNTARPSPGVFLHRVDAQAWDLPILKWVGPWDLQLFMNQLEGSRETPDAKLFGMRVTFKPAKALELGLSRTAQWGGEGRPEDVETFWNLLIGRDNRGDDGLAEGGADEPGNQLGGADWRLSHSIAGISAAFYGQLIGEDEAGGLPSHMLGLAGLETSFMTAGIHNRLAVEVSNTTMEFYKGSGSPNAAYEHPRYPSGYRFRGRPLGASTDNDSELIALKGVHTGLNGHHLSWVVGSAKINKDGGNASAPGGNVWGDTTSDIWYASGRYSFPFTPTSQLMLGAQYYSDPLYLRDEIVESAISATYKLRL